MTNLNILIRLVNDYTRKHLNKIILAVIFSIFVAASTSATAWLLDPAIKKIFLEKDQKLIWIIPMAIIIAFSAKGISLYSAKVIMIGVSVDVTRDIQIDAFSSLINADTKLIDKKHSGEFISNLSNDVSMITNLVSTVILNLFKDSLTLIGLLSVMFYQNWKLSLFAIFSSLPIKATANR